MSEALKVRVSLQYNAASPVKLLQQLRIDDALTDSSVQGRPNVYSRVWWRE